MNSKYIPAPVDTTGVQISDEIMALAEVMAKNTHEVWAKGRMDQGWTYGPVRDDENRKHPCLVAYEELSEEEKDYDRNTSLETIRLILSLGYEIKKVTD